MILKNIRWIDTYSYNISYKIIKNKDDYPGITFITKNKVYVSGPIHSLNHEVL